jgi:fatty-acyl-CoA synthase
MEGLVMNYPLTLQALLRRARDVVHDGEIVTRQADNAVHRYTYGEFHARVVRLMGALRAAGVKPGDRVATFCWNRYQHLELYFAVPCIGAVLHTLNIRLSREQLVYIANHAEDRLIFADESLAGQLAPLAPELRTVQRYVVIEESDGDTAGLPGAVRYEDFLAGGEPLTDWPALEENAAASMCYTSGTTGNPKGALFSHRALYLHTMALGLADSMAIGNRDAVFTFVPMFHVNAWGIPFAGVMTGAKLILPGRNPQAADVVRLVREEGATLAAGVPTIWMMVHQYLQEHGGKLGTLDRIACGGSAVPRSLMETYDRAYGVPIIQLWGMTETAPLGVVARPKRRMQGWPAEDVYKVRLKAGYPAPGMEARIEAPDGSVLPNDGESVGELVVRGPWVIREYYRMEGGGKSFTPDGWFKTGDVAAIDADGYVRIADRVKDLIKSGGEWISSVDMENALMAHPAVAEAAVVARPDPKWDERPVAFLVPKPGRDAELAPAAVAEHLSPHFAKWQIPYPEDVHLIDAIPRTSVGKFDKKVLRRRFE